MLAREQSATADVFIRYAADSVSDVGRRCLVLNHLAAGRSPRDPAPNPSAFSQDGESTVVFYAPAPGGKPDWLGEIFEWVSCADEYSVEKRDSIGRIPFRATYAGRHHLDIRIPYAAVAMRFLEREISHLANRPEGVPLSPVSRARHFTVVTHDVDYLPAGRWNAARRVAKNAAINLLGGDLNTSMEQARMAVAAAAFGVDPLDRITELALREKRRGLNASYYLLPRRAHRRDANYACDQTDPLMWMNLLEGSGFEIGVHGSYTSLDEPSGLKGEYDVERSHGFRPLGGRQHWLRFTLDRLIPALESAGATYDTSFGWPDRLGFRCGACFSFPPYYFAEERPAMFLEIPLVMMDQALQAGMGGAPCGRQAQAEALLSTSRRYGWGGISILWHPAAFGGGWLAAEIGEIFWRLADRAEEQNDLWLGGGDFVKAARERYVEVGLLPVEDAAPADDMFIVERTGADAGVKLETMPQRRPQLLR